MSFALVKRITDHRADELRELEAEVDAEQARTLATKAGSALSEVHALMPDDELRRTIRKAMLQLARAAKLAGVT